MNYLGHMCRELLRKPGLTQRALAGLLGVSLGKCHTLVHEAVAKGYIAQGAGGQYEVTKRGTAYLQRFRVRNAVLLASRIDPRFVPFNRQTPKALMEAEGERLIERLIRQLHERGIYDITVVVGYFAEKYEYLADKYEVKLVYNPEYATEGSLAGLYLVRASIQNTYLMMADYFLPENLFHEYEPESWIACSHRVGETHGWCVQADAKRRVRSMRLGGQDCLVRRGPLFFTGELMQQLRPALEEAITHPGAVRIAWEALLCTRLDDIAVYANQLPPEAVREFTSYEDLRDFDISNAVASGTEPLRYIASAFAVDAAVIGTPHWLETNAVNHVFCFKLHGKEYVCRNPGDEEGRFNTYRQELAVYKALSGHNITDLAVHQNAETGIKISEYYPQRPMYPEANFAALRDYVHLLQRLHSSGARVRHHFKIEDTLRHYDILCRRVGCIQFEDYAQTAQAVQAALAVIAQTNTPRVLCHLSAVTNDQINAPDGTLRFAHWEFAAMCHPLADIAMLGLYCNCSQLQYHTLAEWYLGRPANRGELRLLFSYAAAGGLLWSIWGEFRNSCGEDFVEYAVRMYRQCKRNLRLLAEL